MGDKMFVQKRSDGSWEAKKAGATRATAVTSTQKEAMDRGRASLRSGSGGELIIKGEDGKIRAKDTIPPGKDPYPPKG